MDKLQKNNPTSMNTSVILPRGCKTVREVLTCGLPQISKLERENSQEAVLTAIEVLILGVVENTNVGKSMNPSQMKFGAALLLEKYWYLKMEDISLCFRKGITGEYGKLYDRLDIQILIEWLNAYEQERNSVAALIQLESGKEYAKNIHDILGQDDVTKAMRLVIETNVDPMKAEAKPRHEQSDFERWLDVRWYGLKPSFEDQWLRLAYGKAWSRNAFLKHKHEQYVRISKK